VDVAAGAGSLLAFCLFPHALVKTSKAEVAGNRSFLNVVEVKGFSSSSKR
jgi:hypothetical protein